MVLRMVDANPDLQQKAFSEVADRTSDRAVQTVQVTQIDNTDPSQILATLRDRYPRRVFDRNTIKQIQAQIAVHTQQGGNARGCPEHPRADIMSVGPVPAQHEFQAR